MMDTSGTTDSTSPLACVTCGASGKPTFWGPRALGVCRYDLDPNQDDQGQHILVAQGAHDA